MELMALQQCANSLTMKREDQNLVQCSTVDAGDRTGGWLEVEMHLRLIRR